MKWINTGCDDLEKAARNREMVASKKYISGYVEVETYLKGASLREPLPDWIPLGSLPIITKEDLRWAKREMHEERDDN